MDTLEKMIVICASSFLIVREVKGIITRLCVQWVEEGERSTRVFFGLKKSNGKKKSTN